MRGNESIKDALLSRNGGPCRTATKCPNNLGKETPAPVTLDITGGDIQFEHFIGQTNCPQPTDVSGLITISVLGTDVFGTRTVTGTVQLPEPE